MEGKIMKIIHVVGARPNFIKIASVLRGCSQFPEIESILVHTGQHYDDQMSKSFFDELEIPRPDINLEVGSGSHAQQTAEIMKRFEQVVNDIKPDAVLVVGDVNSTVACVLVASKLGVKTIHVEAGLRSFDRTMPEEINRILTDSISDILFVTEPSGLQNLKNEGIESSRIHFVGNVMIDTLETFIDKSKMRPVLEHMNLQVENYALLTLHRPSNVDDEAAFGRIIDALDHIQQHLKVVFPVHPRTYNNINRNGLGKKLKSQTNVMLTNPLGYLDFMKLMSSARIIITDSGGIQEETTALGIPCLTIRENTERPITITEGTNRLVGTDTERIISGFHESLASKKVSSRPQYWDGKVVPGVCRVSCLKRSQLDKSE